VTIAQIEASSGAVKTVSGRKLAYTIRGLSPSSRAATNLRAILKRLLREETRPQ
jgi:hypothetical protein